MSWRLALAAALIASGCARSEAPEARDVAGRIVTLGGAVTETVFALGEGDRVVGVDTSSSFPAQVDRLPRLGYQRSLTAETVLAFRPALVLASHEAGPPAALEQLRAAGVRVAQLGDATTPSAAAARVREIGALLGRSVQAEPLAAAVESVAAPERASGPRVLFLYARGGGVAMVSGERTQAAAMIALAGAHNATSGFTGYRPISAEAVIAAAPEVVLVPARGLAALGGADGLWRLPGLAHTPAGRAGRVVALDDLLLLGFGPRLPRAVAELRRALDGRTAWSAP